MYDVITVIPFDGPEVPGDCGAWKPENPRVLDSIPDCY
jgi:hypothetical protein